MKQFKFLLFLSICLIFLLSNNSLAQKWETFEAQDYNIKISIPSNWKTSAGVDGDIPYLESFDPEETVYLMIYVYKDASISTEELLGMAVNDLGIALRGEANNENLNGMDAWVAEAEGLINDMEVGMYITAATYDDNNYVAFIFTSIENWDKNFSVMNKIIDSLSPLK